VDKNKMMERLWVSLLENRSLRGMSITLTSTSRVNHTSTPTPRSGPRLLPTRASRSSVLSTSSAWTPSSVSLTAS
jgi:hypothetical protein